MPHALGLGKAQFCLALTLMLATIHFIPPDDTPSKPPQPPNQACAAAACRSTCFLELHIGVWKHAAACCSMPRHAAASNFLSSCACLPAPALLARETFCLPHVSPVCFYLSCHESVICTNNIQSTVNTKHTTFPIRWENSAGEWERQPGTHARKAALQPPPICVEAPPQPNPTIIVNVPRPEPAEPECSQKRRFPYVE